MLTNARRRWPAVEFRVINVAVQGPTAVPQIIDALAVLDRRPERRRDHHGPRRRQRGGPAALLRRGAVPGRVRLPHAGDLRDRPRDRHPAGRLRRRRARVHPDRRRQARRARPGRGAAPDRRGPDPARPGRAPTASTASSNGSTRCAPGRCWPSPTTHARHPRGRRSPRCATGPAATLRHRLDRADSELHHTLARLRGAVAGGDPGARVRDRAARRRTRRCCAIRPTSPPATTCGSGWPGVSWRLGSPHHDRSRSTIDCPTRRPAPSWPGSSSGSSPAAARWRSRWPCGSAASSWPTSASAGSTAPAPASTPPAPATAHDPRRAGPGRPRTLDAWTPRSDFEGTLRPRRPEVTSRAPGSAICDYGRIRYTVSGAVTTWSAAGCLRS